MAIRLVFVGTAILGLSTGISSPVRAQSIPVAPAPDAKQLGELQWFEDTLAIPGVAQQHPDIRYRELAISAYRHGYKERALKMFMRAASYADKPSQAAVALMYWEGQGTSVDRPRAYVWMDLAATRGYDRFIAKREYYWSQLSDAERAEALRVGQDIFAKYDDKLALHRLRLELDSVRMNVVGSHVGFVGAGKVLGYASTMSRAGGLGNGLGMGMSGVGGRGGVSALSNGFDDGESLATLSELYRPSVWKVDEYAKYKDIQWQVRVENRPSVEVGDLQKVPQAEAPPAK